MRKEIWLLCLPLLLLGGCGTQEKAQDPPQIITRKTVQEAKKAETPPEAKETPAPAETPEPAPQKEEQPAPKPAAPEGKNRSILSLNIPTIWKRTGKTLITTT